MLLDSICLNVHFEIQGSTLPLFLSFSASLSIISNFERYQEGLESVDSFEICSHEVFLGDQIDVDGSH